MTHALFGTCHCGRVRATLRSVRAAGEFAPRACDCSFCRKHGAAWVSDPQGELRIDAHADDDLRRYRQGSETADMLLCAHCGVLVAVVFAGEDRRLNAGMLNAGVLNTGVLGAINAGCIDDAALAAPVVVSPQRLSAAEKIERWRRLWTRTEISPPGPQAPAA